VAALSYAPSSPDILRACRRVRAHVIATARTMLPPAPAATTSIVATNSTGPGTTGGGIGAISTLSIQVPSTPAAGTTTTTTAPPTHGAAGQPSAAATGQQKHAPPQAFGYTAAPAAPPHGPIPPPGPAFNNSNGAAAHAQFNASATVFSDDNDGEVDKKTPAYVWRYNLERLLRFTGVPDVDALQPIWQELAEAARSERRPLLEAAMRRTARLYGLSAPAVSHVFLARIMELELRRDDEASPTAGLSMYLLATFEADATTAKRQAAKQWDEVLRGETVPSIRDTAEFFREAGVSPITHWEDATACFERTLVALLCLHGEYHEVVQPMLNFAHWLQTQRQRFTRKTRDDRCLPADLVQRVNLDLGLWLDSVEEEDGPLMFPSWDMLQVTLAGNNMLVNQRPTPPQLGRRANFAGMAALGGRPPPQAPAPPPPPVNPRGTSVGVPNNDRDPDLIIPIGVGLRHCVQACRNANPNVRNDGLPLSDASLPMCLSFHFVGR
jgi:hypothetical protein